MEWLEWVRTFTPIFLFVIITLLGMIAWFGKKLVSDIGDKFKSSNDSISKLAETTNKCIAELGIATRADIERTREQTHQMEKDFLKFQANMSHAYVSKDDHIRHITIVENKIDRLSGELHEAINGLSGDIKILLRDIPKRGSDA